MITKKEMICYTTDASRLIGNAEKVVFPKTVKEVQDIIRTPATDIVPRGAGSGLVGGTIPNNSVVVDMTKMNGILEFNPGKRIVNVESGITLRELNEKLKSRGFEFPIDVSNEGISTIGGMIATNASGDRSMKYGTMKDWVSGVDFVDGKGELIKATKADLGEVCGMEGITGIIVSAKLKVIPIVKRSASVYQSDNLDEVLSLARRLKSEKEVVKLKLFSKQVSGLLGFPEKYNLVIEFDSERGKIIGSEYEDILRLEQRVYYNLASEGYSNREDPKFFFDKIKEFISFMELMNIPYFVHLGSGIIHPFFKDDEKQKREKTIDLIKRSQGKPGKYGIGLMRKDFVDSFEMTIISRVKLRHDPYGRMNKGKVINEMSSAKRYGMTPGVAERISEIKPGAGEERSANLLIESMKIKESPDRKMEEFIKEVSKEDEETSEVNTEDLKKTKEVEGFGRNITSEREEIKERLKDYKETFEPELPEEKRKIIESFARTIPREIVKTESMLSLNQKSPEKIREAEKIEMKERAAVDYKLINNIMNNQVKKTESPGNLSSFGFPSRTENRSVSRGEVHVNDNLDRFVKKPDNSSNTKSSSNDKDIISNIMTNRFGKGFGTSSDNKDPNNKQEERK